MTRALTLFLLSFSLFSLSVPAWADEAKDTLDHFDVQSIFSVSPVSEGAPSENITTELIKESETAGSVAEAIILRVINILMLFIGTVAMLMLMAGGLTWILADGEEGRVDRGKAILTQTITGLVVALLSYAIVTFVVSFFF